MKRTQRRQAFTLVELLVAIGIVALLAGILFPVFSAVRGKARQAACLSNLRQLGQATFLYAQDYDDLFPYGGDPSDTETDSWRKWQGGKYWEAIQQLQLLPPVMASYVKSRELWRCPADTGFENGGAFENIPLPAHPTSFDAFGMSYGYVTLLALDSQTIGGARAWSRKLPHSERNPAEIPLLYDHVGRWHGGTGRREDGRLNMVFVDGHARSVTRKQADDLVRILFTIPSPPAR